MWKYTQHSFAGGQLDADLMGRQDLAKYFIGATTLENFIVKRQGCLEKRRGTELTTDLAGIFGKDAAGENIAIGSAILIPFTYEKTGGNVVLLATPATGGTATAFVFSRDGVLMTRTRTRQDGTGTPQNDTLWNHYITRAPETEETVEIDEGTGLPVDVTYTVTYAVTRIETPYLAEELQDIVATQSGDVIFMAHQNHPFARLTRKSATEFVYDAVNFQALGGDLIVPKPTLKAAKEGKEGSDDAGTKTVSYVATAVVDGVESEASEKVDVSYKMPWANTFQVKITVTAADGSGEVDYFNVYKKSGGDYGYIGKIEPGETLYDDYISPDVSLTPPVLDPHFDQPGDYPGCVAIYNQRLCVGATKNKPFTFWMSVTGDLYNFNEHDSLREDDALEATVPATEFPEINHMMMAKDLLLFCDNGEWVVSPTSGNALTYKTVQIKLQSQIGCSKDIFPLMVGDEIVFAETTGKTLRASRYDFVSDGYQSTDLSVMSQDIFEGNPIIDMEYKQHPDSEIVCVLQDGTLAILSYMKEHEVAAWGKHTLGGGLRALNVCSDKALRNGTTDTYILVAKDETQADGTTRAHHYILRMRETVEPTTVRAAVCMDAIEWVQATYLTTLKDGQTAVDLQTGQVAEYIEPGKEYAFGYPYGATFRSVRPEAQGESTIQFELKNATSAELRLLDASPVRVVPTVLEEATQNQWMDAGPQVTPDAEGNLTLGEHDVLVNLAGVAAEDGALTLKSETHWPLKVLSFSVNYEFDPRLINQEG